MVAFSLSHVGGTRPTHFAEGRTRDSLSGTRRASEPQGASVIADMEGLVDAARAMRRGILSCRRLRNLWQTCRCTSSCHSRTGSSGPRYLDATANCQDSQGTL
ncbi:hypothetical protein PV05_02050 [Exophiala xenobiotica]|uniref:Uncharacterized protein n=1 Tax=Exophiala xenobiotica TaxID=348802 RepID=A0A0D2F4X8_9EURO|nr:uncharacterized protein PV05_02050 [Exophiala xenobiotica]KIW61995.1 hypothetical protein PV05_02050 [Exophiala xenobiotica]